jgi:hypothetical protein
MAVVMTGMDAKYVFELAPAEDEQPVEALAPHATDPALGVCVGVRRLHGCPNHSDSFALEDVIKAAAEFHVAIVDLSGAVAGDRQRHQQVACLLGCPGAGRVRCAGDELDSRALERKKEEHVDPSQPGGLDGEEIACERRRGVLAQEVSPRNLVSLRRRWQPVADEDRSHGGRRNGNAKAAQFADDALVAPRTLRASIALKRSRLGCD